MNKLVIATVVSATLMTGCANMNNAQQGQLIGAALGTVAAHNLSKGHRDRGLALVVGALAGTFIGSEVGAHLDARDRQQMGNTMHTALETSPDNSGQTWRNPNSGNSGRIVPTTTYQTNSGQYCREYQQQVIVGGKLVEGFGTACRMPDGSWKVSN